MGSGEAACSALESARLTAVGPTYGLPRVAPSSGLPAA